MNGQSFYRSLGNNKGSILIIAFWALSLLSFFAIYMGYGARQKLTFASRLDQRAELKFAAEAGIRKAQAELRKPDSSVGTDSLKDDWAIILNNCKDVKIGGAKFDLSVVDEEGKININTASLEVMKILFKALFQWNDTEAEELTSAIIDWRDADNSPEAMGAENSYYAGLRYPYECKNAPFTILDELLLVRSVTDTIYNKLKDYITIYGKGAVNINTTSASVLEILGLDEKLAVKVMAFRAGEDGISGTEDDGVFATPSSVISQVSQFTSLSTEEITQFSQFMSGASIGVKSENFKVTSRASYGYKNGEFTISAVIQRQFLETGECEIELKYWRMGA